MESPAAQRMPAVFVGHGNPMIALQHNAYTQAWREFGARVPTPRAVLVVSAHWYINAAAVTAMERPRTIHDFYGFPDELFALEYPAPGLPGLVDEIATAVDPIWIGADVDTWGLDHGTWSVLVHMFPEADVPVVQLAIDANKSFADHVELGRRLAPLRDAGVLIIGSGNVVHNRRPADPATSRTDADWAYRFEQATASVMRDTPGEAAELAAHPDYAWAAPTPDHFVPLLYIAGLADAAGEAASVMVDGYNVGSLSMTAFALGDVF